MDKKAIFVLVIALFLLIFKLNATGALTDPSSTINYGQLFYDDDDYDDTLAEWERALCDSIVFGGGDCFVSGICGGISSEGSTEDLGNIEDTEGILVTFDDEGNMIVGAQLSAGRSPPIRTFDEETGEEKWIRYYKIEYELRDRADGHDTTYSIKLYDEAVAGANILFIPVDEEEIVDGNITSFLGSDRIVFAAEGDYKGILMTFEPEMESHGTWGSDDYTSLLPNNVPVEIVDEGTTTTGGYGGQTPASWGSIP